MKDFMEKACVDQIKELQGMEYIDNCINLGMFDTKVNTDKSNTVSVLNKRTAGIGVLIKPLHIASCECNKDGNRVAGAYYGLLSDNISKLNHEIARMVAADMIRLPLMTAINTVIGLLRNEFESLPDSTIENVKKNCYMVAHNWIIPDYSEMIDYQAICNYCISLVGAKTLQDLYVQSFVDEESEEKFFELIIRAAEPHISTYAISAATHLTNVIHDSLYESFLGELSESDFTLVCKYIKPIILSFIADMKVIAKCATYQLVKTRLYSTPLQTKDDMDYYNRTRKIK